MERRRTSNKRSLGNRNRAYFSARGTLYPPQQVASSLSPDGNTTAFFSISYNKNNWYHSLQFAGKQRVNNPRDENGRESAKT